MKTLSITIDDSLLKALDRGIREFDFAGRSEAVREAIRDWLAKRELKKKVQAEIAAYKKQPVKKDEFESLMNAQEWPK